MIKAYLTFCAVIYHFYIRKKDDMPTMYTFGASSLMLFANLFGMYDIIMFYIFPELLISNLSIFTFFGFICLINYLLVFRTGKYRKIVLNKNNRVYSIVYIIFSILLIAWITTKHRERNLAEQHIGGLSNYHKQLNQ